MNTEELINKNKLLEEELQKTKDELYTTKEHLKKYTSPTRHKTYYENHKEEILEKMKQKQPDAEKRKEINQRAYLKRKEKSKESQDI